MGKMLGGVVKNSNHREYGRGKLKVFEEGFIIQGFANSTHGLEFPWRLPSKIA